MRQGEIQPRPALAVRDASARDVAAVRQLLREYRDWLGLDLSFQDFEQELGGLPGNYAGDRGGALLVAESEGAIQAMVALRRLDDGACEMKRLYVREPLRGRGLGRRLAEAIIARARAGVFPDAT